MAAFEAIPALAYYRGEANHFRGDQELEMLQAFAARNGYHIISVYKDLISAEAFPDIPAFRKMLKHSERSSVTTILVASTEKTADDPLDRAVIQYTLEKHGLQIIGIDGSTFSALADVRLIRRTLEIAARCEKALLSSQKQKVADKRRSLGPKHRRRYAELVPDAVTIAKHLRERSIKTGTRLTLRTLSAKLAELGHFNTSGKQFHPDEIRRMLNGPRPRPNARIVKPPQ